MSWNYRVVLFDEPGDKPVHQIQEVYYNEDGTPRAYCNAVVAGETVRDVMAELILMRSATRQPVLNAATDFDRVPR